MITVMMFISTVHEVTRGIDEGNGGRQHRGRRRVRYDLRYDSSPLQTAEEVGDRLYNGPQNTYI